MSELYMPEKYREIRKNARRDEREEEIKDLKEGWKGYGLKGTLKSQRKELRLRLEELEGWREHDIYWAQYIWNQRKFDNHSHLFRSDIGQVDASIAECKKELEEDIIAWWEEVQLILASRQDEAA